MVTNSVNWIFAAWGGRHERLFLYRSVSRATGPLSQYTVWGPSAAPDRLALRQVWPQLRAMDADL